MKYDKAWLEAQIWDMADRSPNRIAIGDWSRCIMGTIISSACGQGCHTEAFRNLQSTLMWSDAHNLYHRTIHVNDEGRCWGKIPQALNLVRPEPPKPTVTETVDAIIAQLLAMPIPAPKPVTVAPPAPKQVEVPEASEVLELVGI